MRRRRQALSRTVLAASVTSALALAVAGGCGSEGETAADDGADGASVPSSSSGGSSSGASSSSSNGSSGAIDGSLPDVQFAYDAPMRPDSDACAETTAFATQKPLDMYVMLDRSGSMNAPYADSPANKGDCNVGQSLSPNSRWCRAINALSSYFKSPASAGNAAAFQSFLTDPVTAACDGSGYSSSTVPGGATGFVALPSSGFDARLNQLYPQGATPTEGALRGLVQFTGANRRAGRTTIGVLITDGDPTYCDTNLTNLSAILQAHFTSTGVRTFVIGMTGATFASLETIATGGNAPLHGDTVGAISDACGNGAGPCRHFNIAEGDNDALAEALSQIQGLAIACQYAMPKPAVGAVNPNDVTVEYFLNGVPPGKKLTRVTNAAACVADGWYYDDNGAPSTITLCSTQCNAVEADPGAKIHVSLGCLGG